MKIKFGWMRGILMIVLLLTFFQIGCATSPFKNKYLNDNSDIEKRTWITRCFIENQILKSSHGDKLPPNFDRVYRLNGVILYRGGMLQAKHIPELAKFGVRNIITLNSVSTDTCKAIQDANIRHVEYNLTTTSITIEKIEAVILDISKYPDPVYIHCRAGADRTGLVVACLRASLGENDRDKLFKEMNTYCHVTFSKYRYYYDIVDHFIAIGQKNN